MTVSTNAPSRSRSNSFSVPSDEVCTVTISGSTISATSASLARSCLETSVIASNEVAPLPDPLPDLRGPEFGLAEILHDEAFKLGGRSNSECLSCALRCSADKVNKRLGNSPDRYAAPTVCRKPYPLRPVPDRAGAPPQAAYPFSNLGKLGNRDSIKPKPLKWRGEGASRVDRFGEGRRNVGGAPSLSFSSPSPISTNHQSESNYFSFAPIILDESDGGIAVGDLSGDLRLEKGFADGAHGGSGR